MSEGSGISKGGTLSDTLADLEASGFVRRYVPYGWKKRGSLFQLIDPFSLFHLRFVEDCARGTTWEKAFRTSKANAWRGYAFELVCLLHERQLLHALGIASIETDLRSWRSERADPGAQIDLVIDRADGIVDLCEMKWASSEYAITKAYDKQLCSKLDAFSQESATTKALHLVMVTPFGVRRNEYYSRLQASITMEALFAC